MRIAAILTAVTLIAATVPAGAACPIDLTDPTPQFGAASGIYMGWPISAPVECGYVTQTMHASGAIGGTAWSGSGWGSPGRVSHSYFFTLGSGWWGSTPASAGTFVIPDLVISGPAATADVVVNVRYGGTVRGDYFPPTQTVNWRVFIFDAAGNTVGDSGNHQDDYAPDGTVVSDATPVIAGLPVGVPLRVQVSAQWSPKGTNGVYTWGTDFLELNDLNVLTLPSGFTADSTSFHIVDNVFEGIPVSPVPDGATVPGTELRAAKNPNGADVDVTWDAWSCPADDYVLVVGNVSELPTYRVTERHCDLGTTGAATFTPSADGVVWFVVVGKDAIGVSGGFGFDSSGTARASDFLGCGIGASSDYPTCP